MQVYILLPAHSIDKMYIDGTDVTVEGSFVSSTGVALSYTNWGSGEPNDAGAGEDCIDMRGNAGVWNDFPCTAALPTVCEIEPRKFHGDASVLYILLYII